MNSIVSFVIGQIRTLPTKNPLISAIVIIEVIYLLLPTLIVFVVSFQAGDLIKFPPDNLSLEWYVQIPREDRFISSFFRSIIVATGSTLVSIPIGILTGIGLIRYKIRFRNVFQVYFLLPFTVPLVVTGTVLLIILGRAGLIGQMWTVILGLTIINLPFMIWSVASRVNALDQTLEDAAKSLGAEEVQTFIYITLPMLMPGVITGSLVVFVLGLNEFLVSLIITTNEIVTLPVVIYTSIRQNLSPLLASVASIYVIVAFLSVIITDKLVGLEEFLSS
jgi:putative spermidine/putrescine transport system permease protein